MMYNAVINLLFVSTAVSLTGDIVETVSKRAVFADVRSIGMRETYQAFSVGLKPELIFVIADFYDYNGEQKIEYEGTVYHVLRTYRKNSNNLELVVTSNAKSS